MRIVVVFSCILLLTACGIFKKKDQTETVDESNTEPQAEETMTEPTQIEVSEAQEESVMMAYHEICDLFLLSMQSGSSGPIQAHFATVELAKALSPEETSEKTRDEIETAMIDPLIKRFEDNLLNLRKEAASNKIDLNKQRIRNCLYFDTDDPEMVPRVLSVEFGVGESVYKVPVTVLDYKGKTYIFEILNTTNIFNK